MKVQDSRIDCEYGYQLWDIKGEKRLNFFISNVATADIITYRKQEV